MISRTVREVNEQESGPVWEVNEQESGPSCGKVVASSWLKGKERLVMRPGVRIIKQDKLRNTTELSNERVDKTDHQSQRDTATIVKGWISEWQQRRRSTQRPSLPN